MRALTAVVVFFLAPNLYAGDAPIFGAEKPVPAGGFARLSVKVEEGDQVSWSVRPAPITRDQMGGKLNVSRPAKGNSISVSVTVVNFDKRRLDQGEVEVTFAGGVEPDPDVNPDVDPIETNTTIYTNLKTVWALEEPQEKPYAKKLAAVYSRASTEFLDKAETWGEVFKLMAAEAETQGFGGELMITQKTIDKYLQDKVPSKNARDVKIEPATKAKAKVEYKRVADALLKLKQPI